MDETVEEIALIPLTTLNQNNEEVLNNKKVHVLVR
jgi:hypothetical protein